MKTFNVNDKVRFDFGCTPELKGTGTVLGQPFDGLAPMYIVLLNKPISGQRAVLVLASQMDLVTVPSYRILKLGEIIKENDEYLSFDDKWYKTCECGHWVPNWTQYRRRRHTKTRS
jgi:hypothetical protein